jgi:Fe-S-cluster containining protein
MAPEVFLVASHLRQERKNDFADVIGRIRAADLTTRGLSSMERAIRRLPCGLLNDRLCSVYSVRPSSCRGFTSTSVKACEKGFNGENVQINTPSVWTVLKGAHKQAMWAGLAAAELPAESYELHQALSVALETPDGEARWLKGDNIFAGVASEKPASAADAANSQNIIDRLVAGALGREIPSAR